MVLRSLLTAVVLVVAAVDVASAGTLTTPPLPGGTSYKCQAINLATKAREIDLAIFSFTSGSVGTKSCMGLQPGRVCEVVGDEFSNYCVVTFTGSKRTIRASLTAMVGGAIAAAAAAQ